VDDLDSVVSLELCAQLLLSEPPDQVVEPPDQVVEVSGDFRRSEFDRAGVLFPDPLGWDDPRIDRNPVFRLGSGLRNPAQEAD